MSSAAEADRVGSLIGGKYRLIRLLASGGMGVVFEAQHTVVQRRFAIKLLRRELAERRDALARFQREAAAAGGLENEHVAAVLDLGIADDGMPFMVMEYLAGESLASLQQRERRLPVGRAADLIAQACRGVGAAHAAGIVHRDLKPQNLFVCRRDDGTDLLKVLDFGVAKLRDADRATAETRTGAVVGTVAYMSPEQARGEHDLNPGADIHALGTILYELVCGQRPHPGASQNAVLHHIATQPAIPLSSIAPELPGAFCAAVDRALAGDDDARQPSAAALADEVAPFARRMVWPLPPVSVEPEPADAPPPAAVDSAARPRPWRWMLAAGLAAAVAIVAAATVARHSGGRAAGARATAAAPRRPPPLPPNTRFLSSDAPPGAVAQIETLLRQDATRAAALISAMAGTSAGIWFLGGTPEEVRREVSDAVTRGARQSRVPILVAFNHPFHDCTGYGVAGAADTPSYLAWIDGFAAGIANETAVVILEPNSLGLIPYGKRLDGSPDPCAPTDAAPDGRRVPSPGANPEQRFAQLAGAIERLAARAPNARVYLDGTHSSWLAPAEIADRLHRAGVERTNGFFLNVGNYQRTAREIEYGNAVARSLAAARGARGADPAGLTHFVINTNRNGRGPLDVDVYTRPPYDQPPAVIAALRAGSWCMPPGRGLGPRPTADTKVPLVDAFLWTDVPGATVAACDIAGGARAWDYERYNPWRIGGDAQNHFDPLWGQVLPPPGVWFPACALELARNADPPLGP